MLCVPVREAFLCTVGNTPLRDAKHFFELRKYIPMNDSGGNWLRGDACAHTGERDYTRVRARGQARRHATFAHPYTGARYDYASLYANARVHTRTRTAKRTGPCKGPLKAGGGLPSPKNSPPIVPLSFSPSHGVKGTQQMLEKVKSMPMT